MTGGFFWWVLWCAKLWKGQVWPHESVLLKAIVHWMHGMMGVSQRLSIPPAVLLRRLLPTEHSGDVRKPLRDSGTCLEGAGSERCQDSWVTRTGSLNCHCCRYFTLWIGTGLLKIFDFWFGICKYDLPKHVWTETWTPIFASFIYILVMCLHGFSECTQG